MKAEDRRMLLLGAGGGIFNLLLGAPVKGAGVRRRLGTKVTQMGCCCSCCRLWAPAEAS